MSKLPTHSKRFEMKKAKAWSSASGFGDKKYGQMSYKDSVEDMSISMALSAILQESTPKKISEPQPALKKKQAARQPLETLTNNDLIALGLMNNNNVTLRSPRKTKVLQESNKSPVSKKPTNTRKKKMMAPIEQRTANWTFQDFRNHCYEDDDINLIKR